MKTLLIHLAAIGLMGGSLAAQPAHSGDPASGPATQPASQPTSQPTSRATSQPASQPRLSRHVEVFLKAAMENTKGMKFVVPAQLKEAQTELAAAKIGMVQLRAGKPDVEREKRPNGKTVYRFNTGKHRLDTVAELQAKADVLLRQQKDLDAGRLMVPDFDFASPAEGTAGHTRGLRAKVIRVLGPTEAIVGFGAFRYWLKGVNTRDWEAGKAEALPELAAITGTTTSMDVLAGEMKTVFVLWGVEKFDWDAEAKKVASAEER